ncbi:hypothetical protein [Bradyrhizobium sp. SYSU BS000235]|uniref:hypothetical protein n=1 Tax=Bradyrhizobium sp. SYSU BS000235 TaxID=3411332 RepID=UPI003C754FB6
MERLRRLNSPPPVHDVLLEQAVAEALSRPHEPEVRREAPGFERQRRSGWLRVVVRSAAAVGIAAVVAFLIVVMVPVAQDHAGQADGSSLSMSGILNSVKAAFDPPRQKAADVKPARSEVETLLASSRSTPVATKEQSDTLLQQFLQWQGKPAEVH